MSSFAKLDSRDPFYFLDAIPSGTSSNYCVAFLPDRADLRSPLTLADTWTTHLGVYLFLKTTQISLNQAEFAAALRKLLDDPAYKEVRFLWIENPGEPLANWRLNALAVVRSPQTSTTTTRQPTFFNFCNFSLFIAAGNLVELNSTRNGFVIIRSPDNPQGFHFSTGFDANRLYGLGAAIALPFQGEQVGCLQFDLTLQKPTGEMGYTELAALESGFYLFFKDPNQEASNTQFGITSLRYPFLAEDQTQVAQYSTALTLYPSLDPINPLEPARTYFGFVHPTEQSETVEFPSCYRTNIGYTIHLRPHDTSSRLVFALLPTIKLEEETLASDSSLFYLVPSGNFEMTVPAYDEQIARTLDAKRNHKNLLCGLSGVEYIKLGSDRTNLLSFHTGYAAFAPTFIPGQKLTVAAKGTVLTDLATTAWAYVQQIGSFPRYYAQPDQAVLHGEPTAKYDQEIKPKESDLLWYMEIPTTVLPTPGETPTAFPLFPYGGVRGELASFQQLEQQILSPQRQNVINTIADLVVALKDDSETVPQMAMMDVASWATELPSASSSITDTTITGTTAQGLLATFSDDYETLKELVLALDTKNALLQWRNIERRSPLRTVLQANQVFLVITKASALAGYFSDNQLTIQGWTFNLNPETWRSDTVLIFKFFNKPLIELLNNIHTWSQPETFIGDAATIDATRKQLIQVFQTAIDKDVDSTPVKERENYTALAWIARQENWSGVLVLNVPIPPSNLPPELLALSAGIDPSKFYAQYVGIEATPIAIENKTMVPKQSSLFGLINYQDDSVPTSNSSGYNFQVRNLRVLFQNSQIKTFASEITITLDKLFDERTQLLKSTTGRNIINLKGTAENHDGRTTYAFSFSGDNHFALPDSPVLNEVEIIKAQLSTDPIADLADPKLVISGRFTFWGRLNFRKLVEFDILSFGADDLSLQKNSESEVPNDQFLSFANLVVTMSFPKQTPQDRTFAFVPQNLAFDLQRSKVRQGSLYAQFPLKVTGLLHSSGDKKVSDFNYLSVRSPVSTQLTDGSPWYGLTFDLDLGSFGALSGNLSFVGSLVAAWNPGASDKRVFVGLRLPGISAGIGGFSIQGVIKLSFKTAEFLVDTSGDKAGYLLKLKNLLLKVLVFSMPPNAQTQLIIFGNPDGTVSDRSVGWYAAYAKDKSEVKNKLNAENKPK